MTVDGRVIENKASGEVAQMISQAFQYKGEVVNLRAPELANFRQALAVQVESERHASSGVVGSHHGVPRP